MENNEQAYIKGFNAGYLLSQNEPELLKQLLNSKNADSEYFQDLTQGRKQHDKEVLLAQIKEPQIKSKDRDLSR